MSIKSGYGDRHRQFATDDQADWKRGDATDVELPMIAPYTTTRTRGNKTRFASPIEEDANRRDGSIASNTANQSFKRHGDSGRRMRMSEEISTVSRSEFVLKADPCDDVSKIYPLLIIPKRFLMVGGFDVPIEERLRKGGRGAKFRGHNYALKGYRLLMGLLHLTNVARTVAFCALHIATADDTMVATSLEALCFMAYGTAMYISEQYSLRYHFPPFLAAVHDYAERFGFLTDLLERRKFVRCLSYCSFACNIVFSFIWTSFGMMTNAHYILFPLDEVQDGHIVGSFISMAVFIMFLGIPIYGFLLLYTGLIHTIQYEFEATAQAMASLLAVDDVTLESRFDECRERYQVLCRIVFALSRLTRTSVVLTLFFDMIVVCLCIYGLSSANVSTGMILSQVYQMVITLAGIAFVTGKWGQLHTAELNVLNKKLQDQGQLVSVAYDIFRAFGTNLMPFCHLATCKVPYSSARAHHSVIHSICGALNNTNWTNLPTKILSKMNLLLTQCITKKSGIDVYGLFVLDNSTLLMISGTLLTYCVVVLQFQLDKDLTIKCRVRENHTTYEHTNSTKERILN